MSEFLINRRYGSNRDYTPRLWVVVYCLYRDPPGPVPISADAWAGARIIPTIAARRSAVAPEIRAIAWKTQLRSSARYRKLKARNLPHNKIVVAIARELAGFIWAIAQRVPPGPASVHSA
jgi:hypothetical protein